MVTEALALVVDPPVSQPGATVMLDRAGILQRLTIVLEPTTEAHVSTVSPDWSGLFEAAGLRLADFDGAEPLRVPPVGADRRFGWIERSPPDRAMPTRIEAAAIGARPVHFEVLSPYPAGTLFSIMPLGASVLLAVVVITLIFAAALLARRNIRLGRSDRSAAFRIALFSFALFVPIYMFGVHHVPGIEEVRSAVQGAIVSLAYAAVFWLTYVAIEPLVRRRWPDLIVSSTRLLAGRLRDPLIGRDFLIGAVLGATGAALSATYMLTTSAFELSRLGLPVPYLARSPLQRGSGDQPVCLDHPGRRAGFSVSDAVDAGAHHRAAAAVAGDGSSLPDWHRAAGHRIWFADGADREGALVAFTVTRYGILAMLANTLFFLSMTWFPLTLDLNAFYFASSLIPTVLLLTLAWCALYITLGGKPLGGWTERGAI